MIYILFLDEYEGYVILYGLYHDKQILFFSLVPVLFRPPGCHPSNFNYLYTSPVCRCFLNEFCYFLSLLDFLYGPVAAGNPRDPPSIKINTVFCSFL